MTLPDRNAPNIFGEVGCAVDATSVLLIGQRCPHLRELMLRIHPQPPVTSLERLRAVLELHSSFLSAPLLPELMKVELPPMTNEALHVMVNTLNHAPVVSFKTESRTALTCCILRGLPHLRYPCFFSCSAAQTLLTSCEPSSTRQSFVEFVEPRLRTADKFISQEPADPRDPLTTHASLQYGLRFRLDRSQGVDGRRAFFASLWMPLLPEEQARLSRWDVGEYKVDAITTAIDSSMLEDAE